MLDPRELRAAFGRFPTGVTVVTARTAEGQPVGFTANSFTSVSLDPPLLLVCPGRHLSSFPVFQAAGFFGVSVLAEGQERVSNLFSAGTGDRFSVCDWSDGVKAVPLIDGRAAGFACVVHERTEAGDHLILVGRVLAFDQSEAGGLGYGPSGYFSLGKERAAFQAVSRETLASGLLDDGRRVFLTPEGDLPSVAVLASQSPVDALKGCLARIGAKATLGVVYAIYDEMGGRRRLVFRGGLESFTDTLKPQPIEELKNAHIPDPAVRAMLLRFAFEFQNQSFGLYVGDSRRGDIIPNARR